MARIYILIIKKIRGNSAVSKRYTTLSREPRRYVRRGSGVAAGGGRGWYWRWTAAAAAAAGVRKGDENNNQR